ncbi:MAG: cytochrome c peroxidase [Saprospiraceae bacterium]
MKNIIYTLAAFLFLGMLTSAVNSFENKTLVVPPSTKTLELPDDVEDYQVEIPVEMLEELSLWGFPDMTLIEQLDDDIATLGRVLFYDDRLSGDNSISCGSCHKQELSFADNVALSDGINDNLTTRNSMALNDLGWQLSTSFFWDFRTDGLESAVLEPILAAHELGKEIPNLISKLEAASEYNQLFTAAYGHDEITEQKIAKALSHFIVSMTSFESKYDVGFSDGHSNFNESELVGLALFQENCEFCHVAPHFGSADPFMFFIPGNNGLDSVYSDLGMGGWLSDPFFEGVFKSSSLRNIEVTAPYMHDGRFETLEEVIDFYSDDVKHNENSAFFWMFGEDFTGYDFTDQEKEDLHNFLKTLTDQNLLTNSKWSDPWMLSTSTATPELANVSVYPNPVSDVVVVAFENNKQETYDIQILDVSGKQIANFQTSETILEVPRNNAPAGVYKLIASNGKEQKVFKLIYQ